MEKKKIPVRKYKFAYVCSYLLMLILGSFHIGYNIGIFANTQELFYNYYSECEKDRTFYNSILNSMSSVGACMCSFIVNIFLKNGRHGGIIMCVAWGVLSIVVNTLTPRMFPAYGPYSTILARVLIGFPVGIYTTIIPSYISEIAPEDMKGLFGCCHQLALAFGLFVDTVIGIYLPLNSESKNIKLFAMDLIFAIPTIISCIQLILIKTIFTFESPQYYINIREDIVARKALEKIYVKIDDAEDVFEELIRERNKKDPSVRQVDSLFSKGKILLILSVYVAALQQFTGINVLTLEGVPILKRHGDTGALMNSLASMISSLSIVIAALISDRIDRKTLLLLGSLGCGISLIIFHITYVIPPKEKDNPMEFINWIFAITNCVYNVIFQLTYGPVTWIIIAEMVPSQWLGYSSASSWGSTLFVSFTTGFFIKIIGGYTFEIYAVVMLTSLFFLGVWLRETRGKIKQKVIDEYLGENNVDEKT